MYAEHSSDNKQMDRFGGWTDLEEGWGGEWERGKTCIEHCGARCVRIKFWMRLRLTRKVATALIDVGAKMRGRRMDWKRLTHANMSPAERVLPV